MTSNHIPQKVLSQRLGEKINGRRVRTAVFTTYTFDPGFFELHVLPILFDKPFHQVEKIRRIQMEEAIRSLDEIAVYYDRTALSQEAQPAQLDFRRIDVRRSTGAFHPKLILLLVEDTPLEGEDPDPDNLSLIVAALSANLTRAGWWENVETGHIDEILNRDDPASRTSFRKDVLGMIHRLKRCCADDENHAALDRIHDFLIRRANRTPIKQITVNYRYNTRLFCGQKSLPDMLQDLKLDRYCENLEIISPYFDKSPANTLQRVIDAVDAQRVRVFLPENADGSAAVSEETYAAIARIENVEWARLPNEMLFTGGRKNIDSMPPRRVHAKVYRFWQKGGWNVTLVGSVNLTGAGHSPSSAGNLEAAFLYDISGKGFDNRWWLEPLERAPGVFAADQPGEDDESQKVPLNVSFRYDWAAGALSYRAEDGATGPIEIYEPGGVYLFAINRLQDDGWVDCGSEAAGKVSELLRSTSFLEIRHAKGKWRILIREEGMHQRPSLMISLTPEEILMYWSLLSPEQQEYFLTEKLSKEVNLQGMDPVRSNRYIVNDTVFDRFAGVYHAFEQLVGYVAEAIDQGKEREAKTRLFGAKYDSLPQLLEKTLKREGADDVMVYITFLCAQQARNRVASIYPEFIASGGKDIEILDQLLRELPAIRSRLSPHLTDSTEFLKWYEQMFLQMIQQPDSGEGA